MALHAIDLFTRCVDKTLTVLLILNGRLQHFSEVDQLLISRTSSDSQSLTGVDGAVAIAQGSKDSSKLICIRYIHAFFIAPISTFDRQAA